MRQALVGLALAGGIVLAGCGGDGGTGPSVTYESVAGTYGGTMSGVTQGVALNASFVLTLTQSQGSLSGTYVLDGAVTDGVQVVPVAGSGTITGSIASGSNPSINFTVRTAACPNRPEQFSGTFDSANRRINAQGPVYVLDLTDCSILLNYQMNVVLQR